MCVWCMYYSSNHCPRMRYIMPCFSADTREVADRMKAKLIEKSPGLMVRFIHVDDESELETELRHFTGNYSRCLVRGAGWLHVGSGWVRVRD